MTIILLWRAAPLFEYLIHVLSVRWYKLGFILWQGQNDHWPPSSATHQYYVEHYLHSSYMPSWLRHKVVWPSSLTLKGTENTCYFRSLGLYSCWTGVNFWCIVICYLWPRIILWGRQNFDNYRKCGVRICNNELAALDELVWAHYAVCQYQLKGQFYGTTCSHCFKPFYFNTPP